MTTQSIIYWVIPNKSRKNRKTRFRFYSINEGQTHFIDIKIVFCVVDLLKKWKIRYFVTKVNFRKFWSKCQKKFFQENYVFFTISRVNRLYGNQIWRPWVFLSFIYWALEFQSRHLRGPWDLGVICPSPSFVWGCISACKPKRFSVRILFSCKKKLFTIEPSFSFLLVLSFDQINKVANVLFKVMFALPWRIYIFIKISIAHFYFIFLNSFFCLFWSSSTITFNKFSYKYIKFYFFKYFIAFLIEFFSSYSSSSRNVISHKVI